MKRMILIAAAMIFAGTTFAQSERMNRTNSRNHYPPDTTRGANTRMEDKTEGNKTNPTNTTTPANPTNNSQNPPPNNNNTNNRNNGNNNANNPNNKR